jgi:hypothetical protein
MQDSHHHRRFVWIAFVYAAVIALVLYPALHEELGFKLLLWNCIPPTLGLLVIATALDKSRLRMLVSVTFALFTVAITTFFSAAWLLTPLDPTRTLRLQSWSLSSLRYFQSPWQRSPPG